MDPAQTALYAEEIIRLADTAALADPISACEDAFSLDDAYRVSCEVLRRREASGWRRVGRKIGFTNRTIYDQYKVYAPIFGYMYRETVALCHRHRARLRSQRLPHRPLAATDRARGLLCPALRATAHR